MFNKNDRREKNVKIFEDTAENINNNEKLQDFENSLERRNPSGIF